VSTQDILGVVTPLVNSFDVNHPIVCAIRELSSEIRELRKALGRDIPRDDQKLITLNKLEAVVAEHPSLTQRQWAKLAGVSPAYVCKAMKKYPKLFGREARKGNSTKNAAGEFQIDGIQDDENDEV
jgi:hypothetical protein